jgi:deoxyribonuclease V
VQGIPHPWDLEPAEAILLQRRLAALVDRQTPLDLDAVQWVAGVDVSVKDNISRAAIVVMTFPGLLQVEFATARMPTPMPYVPGLLSFREGPAILAAHAKLTHRPDVYIFDGMGIIHPRRLGIASHMGLWLDAPSVGCGKSHFIGEYDLPGVEKGAYTPLYDKGEQLGVVLRTRANVKPVYVSPGHRATIDTARELVMRCTTRYRLPEPIRAAHKVAGAFQPGGNQNA